MSKYPYGSQYLPRKVGVHFIPTMSMSSFIAHSESFKILC